MRTMATRRATLVASGLVLVLMAPWMAVGQSVTPLNIFQATLARPGEKTPDISTEELRRALTDACCRATVFDARPFKEFAISHIPGALNVSAKPGQPTSLYISDVHEIDRVLAGNKAAPIVLYCNGPFCGKSRRLAEELLAAGFTNVRRYQLGIPVWRALGGVTEIALEGATYVHEADRTAWFIDSRDPAEFLAGTVRGARNVPKADVSRAKDDGRLPMEDHNTRIVVFGRDGAQARAAAEEITRNAFHNVAFFGGSFEALRAAIR